MNYLQVPARGPLKGTIGGVRFVAVLQQVVGETDISCNFIGGKHIVETTKKGSNLRIIWTIWAFKSSGIFSESTNTFEKFNLDGESAEHNVASIRAILPCNFSFNPHCEWNRHDSIINF